VRGSRVRERVRVSSAKGEEANNSVPEEGSTVPSDALAIGPKAQWYSRDSSKEVGSLSLKGLIRRWWLSLFRQ